MTRLLTLRCGGVCIWPRWMRAQMVLTEVFNRAASCLTQAPSLISWGIGFLEMGVQEFGSGDGEARKVIQLSLDAV